MQNEEKLNNILRSFQVNAKCISHKRVRNISLYDLSLAPGTRIATLEKYAEEMALALRAKSKLHFTPIIERGVVQAEVVEENPHKISLLNGLATIKSPLNFELPIYLGNSINGQDIWTDLSEHPHTLIGGTSGSGKTILLHTILVNLILKSRAHSFVIDTKDLSFLPYTKSFKNISIYNSYKSALEVVKYLLNEMKFRYARIKNGENFNPIVLIIDEFADLIAQDFNEELYQNLCSLTQKCRGANIYCIIATQRPSADIIKGQIKANLSARITCKTASKIDSRIILDRNGAELLVGNGDAIINNYNYNFVRFQTAYVNPDEVINVKCN